MDVKPARDNWGIREPNFFPYVGRSEENLVWKDIKKKKAIQRAGKNRQQDSRETGRERLARWKLPFLKRKIPRPLIRHCGRHVGRGGENRYSFSPPHRMTLEGGLCLEAEILKYLLKYFLKTTFWIMHVLILIGKSSV